MSNLSAKLRSYLDDCAGVDLHRSLRPASFVGAGRIERNGRQMLDFSSNDYLGLARHPQLSDRARDWASRMGCGYGASRLVTGTHEAHLSLEEKIARFKGTEAALLFATGWQANAAVIPAILAAIPGAVVLTDRLIHASMHAGCAMANVRQTRFAHNDMAMLETLLDQSKDAKARIILTESVFSMDGDRSDIAELVRLARKYDAAVYLDEAHATGVLGPGGAGISETVPGGVDVTIGTFSKALGGFGAYVAGSRVMIDYLINKCSGFIYTTALPPAVLGAIDAALDLVPGMDAERAHLSALGNRLRQGLASRGFAAAASSTQIVPAIVGKADDALALSARLEDRGMIASAIRPPTVSEGTSRLRLTLRAVHTESDVDDLLLAIGDRP